MTKEQSSGASKTLDPTREAVEMTNRQRVQKLAWKSEIRGGFIYSSEPIPSKDPDFYQTVSDTLCSLLEAKEAAEAEAYEANILLSAMKKYLEGEPSNPPVTGLEKKDLADKEDT